MELQRSLPDYQRESIAVFAISYDPVTVLAEFSAKQGITYPLLADDGSVVIRRLGLLNERVYDQHAVFGIPQRDHHWGVAYPGAFLLDEQGVVISTRFLENYRERESGAAMLEHGFGLSATADPGPTAAVAGPGVHVSAQLDAPRYRVYQRRWLTVRLAIAPGMHVYGLPIADGYQPLQVTVEPIEGMKAGAPQWPATRPFRMEGLAKAFQVYEGAVTVTLPLTFTRKPGDLNLRVTVRYQACSVLDCLPPTALTLSLPLVAENLVDLDR